MKQNVVAPSVGESITEVSILKWAKQSGQAVRTGEVLLEIESDKATVEIVAEKDGVLNILKKAGETVRVGEKIGEIDTEGKATVAATPEKKAAAPASPAPAAPRATPTPTAATGTHGAGPAGVFAGAQNLGPAARKIAAERGVDVSQLQARAPAPAGAAAAPVSTAAPLAGKAPEAQKTIDRPGDRRVPMSRLRSRIAERLVQAQHTAAILTTFNEADMSAVMKLRSKHKEAFKQKHGVSLGFMSFFTRACVEALKLLPDVNASIDGGDIVYHDYYDIGIAVGTERGLVVPVVRDSGKMGFPDIEKKITELALKARDGKLGIADMQGGTFTISNGGVYGSLLSTPILNPPQSAILGMHKIMERPVAIDGKVELRPMMYLALSYDHRLIDGKGAVTFLIHVKDFIENPDKLGLEY